MILLDQNKTNKITTTCYEKKVDDGGNNYLIEFRNDISNEYFYCVLEDISSFYYRYQTFYINCVSGNTGIVNSNDIYLPLAGFYSYKIYEDDCIGCGAQPRDLNIVEVGKMYLKPIEIITPTYHSNINPDMFIYDSAKYST